MASIVPFPAGHSQPDVQIVIDLEKMSLYINPVNIEKTPMRRMMYRPLRNDSVSGCPRRLMSRSDLQKERLKDFTQASLGELSLVEHHKDSDQESQETVTEITKHDGEQERERGDGEKTGVDLLVRRHSVRVDDGLESFGEGRGSVERGWLLVGSKLIQDGRDGRVGGFLNRELNRKPFEKKEEFWREAR